MFKPETLYAASDTPHAVRVSVLLGGAVLENEILLPNGASGRYMRAIHADADVILTSRGFLLVAMESGASGDKIDLVPWRMVRDVNTGGATVGDPVFLSSTAGGWALSEPTSGDGLVVGTVLVVSATVGVVILAPRASLGADRAIRGLAAIPARATPSPWAGPPPP